MAWARPARRYSTTDRNVPDVVHRARPGTEAGVRPRPAATIAPTRPPPPMLELSTYKPILTALILPPVPWLLLTLLGATLAKAGRRAGMPLVLLGATLIWLSACEGSGRWLHDVLLEPPPPLSARDIAALKPEAAATPAAAIVVLGGGRVLRAPESGIGDLKSYSLERLRYGARLARETGLPLAFSGGAGWASPAREGASEAEIAERIAERDFHQPIRWLETESRDTHENAVHSVRLLHAAGIRHIVLVTHAVHMPRARFEFERAAGKSMRITPAPMGYFTPSNRGILDWLPSSEGFEQVRLVLRERLGRMVADLLMPGPTARPN